MSYMSSIISINRFQDGRSEVRLARPGCPQCSSILRFMTEEKLQEGLALIEQGDAGLVNVKKLEADNVSEGKFEIPPEDLVAAVEQELEMVLPISAHIEISGDGTEAFIDIVNHSSEDHTLWRYIGPGRDGILSSKAGSSVKKTYKIPPSSSEVWLRMGDAAGRVVAFKSLVDVSEEE